MPNTCPFTDSSREIAERFLQTIVVVDDRAFFYEEERPHTDLKKPGRTTHSDTGKEADMEQRDQVKTDTHELNAKELIDCFAKKGLVCSIIRPERASEKLGPKTIAVSKRADIVVLDWVINNVRGEKTLELIEGITKDDAGMASDNRVRLIVVYTGEKDLTDIFDTIEERLKTYSPTRVNELTLKWGTTRIAVYAKEGISVPAHLKERVIPVHTLPEVLVGEFAEMTMGLLSNFALASFTAIRDNTHRVITKFSPHLDAPYLAHRALLDPPEDAESHILPLFVSELESVLKDTKIADCISLTEIKKWFNCRVMSPVDLYRRMRIRSKEAAFSAMIALIKDGILKENLSSSYPRWRHFISPLKDETDKKCLSNLTNVLTLDGKSGERFDKELAFVMSVDSRYSSPPPSLRLGTIVAQDEDHKTFYFVCIQPLCDSVRLSNKGRYFPFLKFKLAAKSVADDFGYIVKDRGLAVELRLKIRPHDTQQILFKPKPGGKEIRAVMVNSDWIFSSSEQGTAQFRWIADLKPAHAQRVVNEFASQISRVGLTESEWLRRKAKQKSD